MDATDGRPDAELTVRSSADLTGDESQQRWEEDVKAEEAREVEALVDAYHRDPAGFAVFNSGPEARLIAGAYSGVEPDARTAPVVQWAREELYRQDDVIDWNYEGPRAEGVPLEDYLQQRSYERSLPARRSDSGLLFRPETYNEAVAEGTRRALSSLADLDVSLVRPGMVETASIIEARRILTRESAHAVQRVRKALRSSAVRRDVPDKAVVLDLVTEIHSRPWAFRGIRDALVNDVRSEAARAGIEEGPEIPNMGLEPFSVERVHVVESWVEWHNSNEQLDALTRDEVTTSTASAEALLDRVTAVVEHENEQANRSNTPGDLDVQTTSHLEQDL